MLATGMLVNVGNSSISFVGVEVKNLEYFANIFPFKQVDLDEGLKYLGLFLKPNTYTKQW
jgi:hypothetical protein